MAAKSLMRIFPNSSHQIKSQCKFCQNLPLLQFSGSFLHSKMRFKSSERGSVADRFSWLLAEEQNTGVVDGLKKAYRNKLLPLEKHYSFHDFHSPPLDDTDFDSLPQVLVIGNLALVTSLLSSKKSFNLF